MEDWQSRVIEERAELFRRIGRLDDFMKDAKFDTLDSLDRFLLKDQLMTMRRLLTILDKRIKRFTANEERG